MPKTIKILPDKGANTDSNTYIGNNGEIFFDPSTPVLKVSDGVTSGGRSALAFVYNKNIFRYQDDCMQNGATPIWWSRSGGNIGTTFVAGRIGITRSSTSATISTLTSLFMGVGGELFDSTYDLEFSTILRLNNVDTNTQLRFGFLTGGGTVNPPSNGRYFEKLDADTNWFAVNRGASAQTRFDTGVAITTSFTTFKVVFKSSETQTTKYYINDVLVASTSNTNSMNAGIRPAYSLINSAAADKSYDIDYQELFVTGGINR